MTVLNKTEMIAKNICIATFLTVLTGCGFFTKRVESIVEKAETKNQTATLKPIKKNLYCPTENRIQFIVEDESTVKFYAPLFKSLLENRNYSFVQRSAMYALIELLRRPDAVTPRSRLQFFLRYKGKDSYIDLAPKSIEDQSLMPYLKGVESLLKYFDTPTDMMKIADILDANMPTSINVSSALELFLQEHKDDITRNEELTEIYLKGDEILTKHESFKKLSLKKIVQQYRNSKKTSDNNYSANDYPLNTYKGDANNIRLKCNFDINKETVTKKDLTEDKVKKTGHYFAIMEGSNIFIATVSSILPEKTSNLKGTYFFNNRAPSYPLPFCEFKTKTQDTLLFSTQGRFPAQHLRHLLTYDIGEADSQQSLQEILTFSRHLFLNNPDRILYESKRGRKSQLDFFLSMNFPIYHVPSLGDLIGASFFTSPNEESKSLIIDDRSSARLRCSY
jgi:hypothetical protein